MPYRNPNRYNDYERYANDNRRNYYPEDYHEYQQGPHTRWQHHDDRFVPQQNIRHFNNPRNEWYGPHRHQPLGWRGDHPPHRMPERPYWRYDQRYSHSDQNTSDRWPEDSYIRDRFANPNADSSRRYRRNEDW